MTAHPVDCIYEGSRKLYINPRECINCGVCEATRPVEAITHASRLAPSQDPVRHRPGGQTRHR